MNDTTAHMTGANLAALNAHRRTDGKFGPWHAAEAPAPNIDTDTVTEIDEDSFDAEFEPNDSPSGSTLWDKTEVVAALNAGTITDEHVWTSQQDDDGDFVTTSGFTAMQGDGYVVTTKPWTGVMVVLEPHPDNDTVGGDEDATPEPPRTHTEPQAGATAELLNAPATKQFIAAGIEPGLAAAMYNNGIDDVDNIPNIHSDVDDYDMLLWAAADDVVAASGEGFRVTTFARPGRDGTPEEFYFAIDVESAAGAAFKISRVFNISDSYSGQDSTADHVPTGPASATATRAAIGKLYESFVTEAKGHAFTPATTEVR